MARSRAVRFGWPIIAGAIVAGATIVTPPPITVPGVMAAPTLGVSPNALSVTLASSPDNGGSAITGYNLRYGTDGVNWTVVPMTSNPQTISGLVNGTAYMVQTAAINAVGTGPYSNSATATPVAAAPTYDADASSFFTRQGVTDTTEKDVINQLVLDLKAAGNPWTKSDGIYFYGLNSPVLHNIKSSNFQITPSGSPTFVPRVGWKGDGVSAFLNTNLDPTLATASNCQQDSLCLQQWVSATTSDVANGAVGVGRVGTTVSAFLRNWAASGGVEGRANNGATLTSGAPGTRLGHRAISRTAATLTRLFLNAQQTGADVTGVSQAQVADPFALFKLQSAYNGLDTIAGAMIGGGLTNAEIAATHAAYRKAFIALGVPTP